MSAPADRFDVVVVGARCAGAPLATWLARGGLQVCLVDKARFPSDTASTHIIQPRGTAALERLGVGLRLAAAGAAQLRRLTLLYDDARVEADYADPRARDLLSTGNTPGTSVRRTVLDAALVEVAADAGVQVRTATAVTALLRDRDGRVCGVRTGSGDVHARVVVGADGRNSTVARLVGAREYDTYPAPRLAAWAYYEGADPDAGRLRIGRIGDSALIACPADSGLHLAGVVPAMARRAAFLADRNAQFTAELRRWPELCDVLAGARRVGPMRIVPDWHGYFRVSAGPGWVLAGDAGNFKDPAAAQGITDALRQAESLAAVLVSGLSEGGDVDATLRHWWRWRDADCRDMHWFAADMGAAGTTGPILTELVRGLGAEDGALPFAQLLNRDVASTDLLTGRRLTAAVTAAARRRPIPAHRLGREAARTGRARLRRAAAAPARRRARRTA